MKCEKESENKTFRSMYMSKHRINFLNPSYPVIVDGEKKNEKETRRLQDLQKARSDHEGNQHNNIL